MKKALFIILVITFVGAIVAVSYMFSEKQKIKGVANFHDCVSAGFPIQESYPAVCRAGDKSFTDPDAKIVDQNPLPTNSNITVTFPQPNTQVSSPLSITGQAKGPWYFEASFPVKLYDANNILLATGVAQAQGNWQTTNFVPFTASLTFPTPSTSTGTLVLEKDNPSGEPQNADSVSIPLTF